MSDFLDSLRKGGSERDTSEDLIPPVVEPPSQPQFEQRLSDEAFQEIYNERKAAYAQTKHIPGKTGNGKPISFNMLDAEQAAQIHTQAQKGLEEARKANSPEAIALHERVIELYDQHQIALQNRAAEKGISAPMSNDPGPKIGKDFAGTKQPLWSKPEPIPTPPVSPAVEKAIESPKSTPPAESSPAVEAKVKETIEKPIKDTVKRANETTRKRISQETLESILSPKLAKGLLGGAVILGGGAMLLSSSRSLRSNAKVRRDPSSAPKQSALVGAGLASMLLSRGKAPAIKYSMLGFGALASLSGLASTPDPKTTAIVGAAGTLGFLATRKLAPYGIQALSDTLSRGSGRAITAEYAKTVSKVLKNFPLVGNVAGLVGGLITIPVAHNIYQRVLASHKRRTTDHADISFMPSWGQNNAGNIQGRRSREPRILQTSYPGTINLTGSISSYYDTAHALDTL